MNEMNEAGSDGLRGLLFGDLDEELGKTRRVLERVPQEKLDWRPHERSMTVGGLATHLANLPLWPTGILSQDSFDVGAPLPRLEPMTSVETILAHFDRQAGDLRNALTSTSEGALLAPWRLVQGDQVLAETTRAAAVRTYGISHIIHHRAQLGVYLRLLDVPVPRVYGPTADER
jgi:uncharacterized damage-inducible protein DinB